LVGDLVDYLGIPFHANAARPARDPVRMPRIAHLDGLDVVHEARQVGEVVPEAEDAVGRRVDDDRALDLRAEITAHAFAGLGRADAGARVGAAVARQPPIDQAAAEAREPEPRQRKPPQAEAREGRAGDHRYHTLEVTHVLPAREVPV